MPKKKKRNVNRRKRILRKKRRVKKGMRTLHRLFLVAVVVVFSTAVYFLYDLPSIENVKPISTKPSITVLANDGTPIASYGGTQGKVVGIDDVPQHLIEAVLSIEDRRFYRHFGIDPMGLARAMWVNVKAGGFVQGGSTITQQLTKNLFLTPDKTIKRKVQEALMALQIESKYTKNEILEAYLNRVYLGAGAYGVDAASQVYFNKHAKDLTLWESAILAGLLKAPSRYSPSSNPDLAKERAAAVIKVMEEAGYVDSKTVEREIKRGKVKRIYAEAIERNINYYFADWVINQIDSFISTTDGDIVVRTTLDPGLQTLATEKQQEMFKFVSEDGNLSQIAMVTQAYDGAVLAMVGGVDYKKSQFNRVTQAQRQPGSIFKPFVYLAALESGFTPDNFIEDAPIEEGEYQPSNYGGEYFGTVTLREALVRSLNTATVRLLQKVGVEKVQDVTDRIGLEVELPRDLSIALGTAEVSLLKANNAYAVIANGGKMVWPYAVISVENNNGEVLYQRTEFEHQTHFSERDIRVLDDMLKDVVSAGTGRAARLRRDVAAGKTGTTQNYGDAWFVGYSDNFVTGIWMGNDDNTPMNNVTGGGYPAQLWANYMKKAIDVEVPKFIREPVYDNHRFFDMIGRWSSGFKDDLVASENEVYND